MEGLSCAGAPWQDAFRSVIDSWRGRLGARDRLPEGWAAAREATPDVKVLTAAGFSPGGRFDFPVSHRWTVDSLAGFVYSTSFLPAVVFGDQVPFFEAELARRLAPFEDELVDRVGFAYDLARKGAPVPA
jgi:hypothetical protein